MTAPWRADAASSSIVGVTTVDRSWPIAVGGAVAISVASRLPMVWTPLNSDEGGYLAIARSWRHGAVLYRDVFVDRPQGLLGVFRVLDWLSPGHAASVRVMTIVFGAVLVVATAQATRAVAGQTAGICAALACAVVTSAPLLEGYGANGELLSGALSAAAIAIVATRAGPMPTRLDHRWLFGAGLLAGLAISLRQSGFDGLVVVGGWLALTAWFVPDERRAALRRFAWFIAGTAIVGGVLTVHAALTGWDRWWFAVVRYRLQAQSAASAADWSNLGRTARVAVLVLGTVVLAAVFAAVIVVRSIARRPTRRMPPEAMLLLWPVVSILAFLAGGGYWRHYWLQLGAPLAALAGVAVAGLRRHRRTIVTLMLLPALLAAGWVYAAPRTTWMTRASADWRPPYNERVADWFAAHVPGRPNMYVMCASAGLYAQADADPHYPYLWYTEVREAPRSAQLLERYLADPAVGPQYVVVFQRPTICDPSQRLDAILAAHFHVVERIGAVTIAERVGAAPADP